MIRSFFNSRKSNKWSGDLSIDQNQSFQLERFVEVNDYFNYADFPCETNPEEYTQKDKDNEHSMQMAILCILRELHLDSQDEDINCNCRSNDLSFDSVKSIINGYKSFYPIQDSHLEQLILFSQQECNNISNNRLQLNEIIEKVLKLFYSK